MTDPNLTAIAVVLDASGSMIARREDTIGGFNTFLDEQKKAAGRAFISLIQFSDHPKWFCAGAPIAEVEHLTLSSYRPAGNTALYDAIGETITELGKRFNGIPESQRPGKVVVVIITDGLENFSRIYMRDQVKAMIELQRSQYKWEFIYLGANQDACFVAQGMGIPMETSSDYSMHNTVSNFTVVSKKMSVLRGAGGQSADLHYTAQDRKDLVQP